MVFAATPQAPIDDARKRHAQSPSFRDAAQAQRLVTIAHPIQAWGMPGTKAEGDNVEVDDALYRVPTGNAALLTRLVGR